MMRNLISKLIAIFLILVPVYSFGASGSGEFVNYEITLPEDNDTLIDLGGGVVVYHSYLRAKDCSPVVLSFSNINLAAAETLFVTDCLGDTSKYTSTGPRSGVFPVLSVIGTDSIHIYLRTVNYVSGIKVVYSGYYCGAMYSDGTIFKSAEESQTICNGADDSRNPNCYKTTNPSDTRYNDLYEKSIAVGVYYGLDANNSVVQCSGVLCSKEDHFITASHCISEIPDLTSTIFYFPTRTQTVCSGESWTGTFREVIGATLIGTNSYDGALLQLSTTGSTRLAKTYGWIEVDTSMITRVDIPVWSTNYGAGIKRIQWEEPYGSGNASVACWPQYENQALCSDATHRPDSASGNSILVSSSLDIINGASGSPLITAMWNRNLGPCHGSATNYCGAWVPVSAYSTFRTLIRNNITCWPFMKRKGSAAIVDSDFNNDLVAGIVYQNYIYATDENNLFVLDPSNPSLPVVRETLPYGGNSVVIKNNTLFLNSPGAIISFTISETPHDITYLGYTTKAASLLKYSMDTAANTTSIFVLETSGIRTYDITAAPVVTSTGFYSNDTYVDIESIGRFLYAVKSDGTIDVLNATNANSIILVRNYDPGINFIDIDAEGTTMVGLGTRDTRPYGTSSSIWVSVHNITDTSNPSLYAHSVETAFNREERYSNEELQNSIQIQGDYAYVASDGVMTWDITTRTTPVYNGSGRYDSRTAIVLLNGAYALALGDEFSVYESVCRSCSCPNINDPNMDGVRSNVTDVINVINVAFRGGAKIYDVSGSCTRELTDVDNNGVTNAFDAARIVNVAFRGANPATEYNSTCR